MASPETVRDVANYYAKRGWRVFPVLPDGSKRPALADWPNVATADPSRVESWWTDRYHGHDIGIVCGPESDLLVIDVDSYKEEAEGEFDAWCAKHGACPDTPMVVTPRGGRHLYFKWPAGVEPSQQSIGRGIDVQGCGRFVVAPPSRHPNGQEYAWEESSRPSQMGLAEIPAGWVEAFAATSTSGSTESAEGEDECGPVLAAAGFTPGRIDRKGQMHWTRPGKSPREGTSATVYPWPDHHCVIWSGSVPGVETGRPYGPKGLAVALGVAAPETEAEEDDVALLDASDGLHLSDVGNSSRLIRAAGGILRYVRAWDSWIVYRDGRYFKDARNAIVTEYAKQVSATMLANLPPAGTRMSQAGGNGKVVDQRAREIAWAKHSESAAAIRAMVEMSRAIPGVMVEHDELDADPELLNVGNCTIDLRTGESRPHDPADLLTMQTPVLFDPDAVSPLWERCLETWQPDPEVRRYLQVRAGACATGRATESLDIDYGSGGNGKSRFHSTMHYVLGDYAMVPDSSLLTVQRHQEHRTVVASLFRARCAVGGETKAQCSLNEAMVKNLTGKDPLRARRMREDEWGFLPTHTLIMFSNYKPKIAGTDDGIWRRVRILSWDTTIPEAERDTTLDKKLEAEASGILNWVLEGARIFLTEGLKVPESVKVATALYRASEDITGRFIDEVLTITGDDARTASADIAEAARVWAADLGLEDVPPAKAIAVALENAGCRNLGQRKHLGVRRTVWSGVRISAGQDVIDDAGTTQVTDVRFADKAPKNTFPNSNTEGGSDGSTPLGIEPATSPCFDCGEPTSTRSAEGEPWCLSCQVAGIPNPIEAD